ncbi:MAG: hypothetical protein COW54_07715 [Rhodobacteraceae bacterium CG17_big_fil_post_rev_8_21_14_2_50_63_15]|nr:MAG: hypothetical protein COW54_07715 [Rhodobacteraceae bacterium CG17_big_fil_post_rev_8_21_14_2_50_63_15]
MTKISAQVYPRGDVACPDIPAGETSELAWEEGLDRTVTDTGLGIRLINLTESFCALALRS